MSFILSLLVLKATLHLPLNLLSKACAVQIKNKLFWSDGYNNYLLQQGNGNFEDSKDSVDSQSSQETDSSQEVTGLNIVTDLKSIYRAARKIWN